MTTDYDTLYGARFLSAASIDEDFTATISHVSTETFEKPGEPARTKAVLFLNDEPRGLILNKINAGALRAEYGKAFRDWVGKTIEVRKERVSFGGKQVDFIRVYPERKPVAPRRTSAGGIADDAIPF